MKITDFKFKVGDICIISDICSEEGETSPLNEFKGNIFKISLIQDRTSYPYRGELIKGVIRHSEGTLFNDIDWKEIEISLYKNISWKKMLKGD